MKTLYFDCFSGASGDMIVGALLDVGADFEALQTALATLPVEGYALRAEKTVKKGIAATQFCVDVDPSIKQPHRHLQPILDLIETADLPEAVKAASCESFRRIGVAEATVHGTTVEKIHFHEVGAVDSIVDIVGAHMALHLLGVDRVAASRVPTGHGTVECAHGVLPVPAPATALLLEGVPIYGGGVEGEMVTPTGAALLAQLAESFGAAPAMRIEKVGYGSGTRDHADRANVLRAALGESAEERLPGRETIAIIETNLDDMAPELLAPVIDEALAKGARDAFLSPMTGKKGRPGLILTVLCDQDAAAEMVELLLHNTTTFGVRMRTEQRICLPRTWKTVATRWGAVQVKIGMLSNGEERRAPEYEDCRRVAASSRALVLEVYQEAMAAAVRGEFVGDA